MGQNPGVEYYRPFGEPATGQVDIAKVPAGAAAIVIDGKTYTYKSDFGGADIQTIARNLADAINGARANTAQGQGRVSEPIKSVFAIYYGARLRIIATSPGTAGNSIALSTDDAVAFLVPATLTGGTDATAGSSTVTVVGAATTPQAHTVFSVDAVNAFQLSTISRPFKQATLHAIKSVNPYTVNTDTIYLGLSNDAIHQFFPVYAGTFFTLEAPPGQTWNLNQFYGKAVSALDGFSIIYS